MSVYNANTILSPAHAIDDVTNGFALRSDLNGPGFDAGKLVVAPKEGKLVLHFLFDVDELGYLYHNRELHTIATIPREFLLARFAWAVFPLLARFLNTEKNLSVARNVKSVWRVTEEFTRWVDGKKTEKAGKRKRGGAGGDGTGRGGEGATSGVIDRIRYAFEDHESLGCVSGRYSSSSGSGQKMLDTDEEASSSSELNSVINSNEEPKPAYLCHEDATEPYCIDATPNTITPTPSHLAHYFLSPSHEHTLNQFELAEDNRIAREIFPETLDGVVLNRDIAFYPGHRQVERLKQRLRRDRGWVAALAGCCDGDDREDVKRKKVDG